MGRSKTRRYPDATVVEPEVLPNHELLFRGNSSGCGVATIRPRKGYRVHGLLWKITDRCEKSLDIYEGYPRLYRKAPVTVQNGKGENISVMAYIMNNERNLAPVPPSISYYDGIEAGFKQNAHFGKPWIRSGGNMRYFRNRGNGSRRDKYNTDTQLLDGEKVA